MKRNEQLKVRATTEEKAQILANAAKAGLSLQDYILSVCLGTSQKEVGTTLNIAPITTKSSGTKEGGGVIIRGLDAKRIQLKADREDKDWLVCDGILYMKYKTTKGTLQLIPECTIPEDMPIPGNLADIPRAIPKHLKKVALWLKLEMLEGCEVMTSRDRRIINELIEEDIPDSDIFNQAHELILARGFVFPTAPLPEPEPEPEQLTREEFRALSISY